MVEQDKDPAAQIPQWKGKLGEHPAARGQEHIEPQEPAYVRAAEDPQIPVEDVRPGKGTNKKSE